MTDERGRIYGCFKVHFNVGYVLYLVELRKIKFLYKNETINKTRYQIILRKFKKRNQYLVTCNSSDACKRLRFILYLNIDVRIETYYLVTHILITSYKEFFKLFSPVNNRRKTGLYTI